MGEIREANPTIQKITTGRETEGGLASGDEWHFVCFTNGLLMEDDAG
jgi:hypothetical protein